MHCGSLTLIYFMLDLIKTKINLSQNKAINTGLSLDLLDSFLLLRSGLLHLLVLTPYCEAAHVHRDGDHYFGVPGRLPRLVVDIAGFDSFPLCAPVLEPDLHLHLAKLQRMRDLGALC